MENDDVRFIENPFQKIFNIINPDKDKFYSLLMALIQQFFDNIKIPTLSNVSSDPKQTENQYSAYSGANGYLYTLIRLARYFNIKQSQNMSKFSSSSNIMDGELGQYTDSSFYLQKAKQQYDLIQKAIFQDKSKRTIFSFYISEVCTWVSGMHLGYDLRDQALFRKNQMRIIQTFKNICQNKNHQKMVWQLLYGVPGFLYAVLQIQSQYDKVEQQLFKTKFSQMSIQLTQIIIQIGIRNYEWQTKNKINFDKQLPDDFRLVYDFYKKQYLGGAHGLSGNLNIILISMKLNKFKPEDVKLYSKLIYSSIKFLLKHFINGNFSTSKGSQKIKLVHFCHGAPGVVYCLARFLEMFPEMGIQLGLAEVISRSLDHIWKYGVLRKGYGLCHGISGNAYSFITRSILNCFPQKAQQYKKKAILFGLLREQKGVMTEISKFHFKDRFVVGRSDNPYSLMLGVAGDICFTLDAFQGVNNFPGFEIDC